MRELAPRGAGDVDQPGDFFDDSEETMTDPEGDDQKAERDVAHREGDDHKAEGDVEGLEGDERKSRDRRYVWL